MQKLKNKIGVIIGGRNGVGLATTPKCHFM